MSDSVYKAVNPTPECMLSEQSQKQTSILTHVMDTDDEESGMLNINTHSF